MSLKSLSLYRPLKRKKMKNSTEQDKRIQTEENQNRKTGYLSE